MSEDANSPGPGNQLSVESMHSLIILCSIAGVAIVAFLTWICYVTQAPRSCWSKLPSFRERLGRLSLRRNQRSNNVDPESFQQYANRYGRERLTSASRTDKHDWDLTAVHETSIPQPAILPRFSWPRAQRMHASPRQLASDTTGTLKAHLQARNIGPPQILPNDEHRLRRVHGLRDLRAEQALRRDGVASALAKAQRSPRRGGKPHLTIEVDTTATRAVAMQRQPGVYVNSPHPGNRMMVPIGWE